MYCSRCSSYQCECEDYPIEIEIRDLRNSIQSLEQEVARLKNCHNCKFPIFDYGEMDCPKKDKSFYDKYELRYCDKWEIKK